MDTSALSFAFSAVFTPINMLVILGGTILGIFIGAMPGMSSPMGLSIMLPFTFQLHGYAGIMMLLGIFCGSIYGGSISASLLNTPGTAASAATCLDAYPMSVQMRQPGRALGISTFSSLCGGLFSCVVLVFGATYLAKVALNFKSPEYFALAFFGISIITSVSGKSVIKGLMGGILGLLFATVGVDNFTGTYRFTFGSSFLKGGLAMIPILIGVFAFAQVLKTIEEKYNEQPLHERVKIERVFPRKDDLKTIAPTVVRSSILGTPSSVLYPEPAAILPPGWAITWPSASPSIPKSSATAPPRVLRAPRPPTTLSPVVRSCPCWLWVSPAMPVPRS